MSDSSSIDPTKKTQPLVDWGETSPQEKALLSRVESKILAHNETLQHQHNEPAPVPKVLSPGRWLWLAPSGALALIALVFVAVWSKGNGVTLGPLEADGTLTLRTVGATQTQGQTVRAVLQASAKVRDPQGWSLRAHRTSRLQIERRGARRSRILLREGAVTFQVTPGKMKQFVVECRGHTNKPPLQVVVKGTRFLVWQVADGIRVEVFHGHVLLKRGPRDILHLYQGQGAFLRHEQGQGVNTYQIPTQATNWLAKIESLARDHIGQLAPYIRDLQQGQLLSHKQQQQASEMAAHALQGAGRWAEASQFWLSLYRMKSQGFDAQSSLFQAAQSCRRSTMKRTRCIALFHRFLTRFPTGLPALREASLFWLASLHLQANTTSQRALGIARLRRYLAEFPQGVHIVQARRLLSQHAPPKKP